MLLYGKGRFAAEKVNRGRGVEEELNREDVLHEEGVLLRLPSFGKTIQVLMGYVIKRKNLPYFLTPPLPRVPRGEAV